MENASWTWWGAAPIVIKASQNAWSQMASVKEKDMKPMVMDATETEERGAMVLMRGETYGRPGVEIRGMPGGEGGGESKQKPEVATNFGSGVADTSN